MEFKIKLKNNEFHIVGKTHYLRDDNGDMYPIISKEKEYCYDDVAVNEDMFNFFNMCNDYVEKFEYGHYSDYINEEDYYNPHAEKLNNFCKSILEEVDITNYQMILDNINMEKLQKLEKLFNKSMKRGVVEEPCISQSEICSLLKDSEEKNMELLHSNPQLLPVQQLLDTYHDRLLKSIFGGVSDFIGLNTGKLAIVRLERNKKRSNEVIAFMDNKVTFVMNQHDSIPTIVVDNTKIVDINYNCYDVNNCVNQIVVIAYTQFERHNKCKVLCRLK